jgi:predicted dinucleotide-binding enzyme
MESPDFRGTNREDLAMSHIKRRIVTILKDDQLDETEKVEILRQLEADSLSKERSATEGMTPVDGDDGEDLKAIEQALRKMGQQPVEAGASSL